MKIKFLASVAILACLTTTGVNAGTLYIDSINAGQRLLPGDILRSANGKFELSLQIDGLLARWFTAQTSYWNSGTTGTSALFQYDANFVLYRGAELAQNAAWTVNKGVFTPGAYKLSVGFDGSLTAYSPMNIAVWSLPGPTPVTPGPCPGGGFPTLYPACGSAGTTYQYNTFVSACSFSDAQIRAWSLGYTPGACR